MTLDHFTYVVAIAGTVAYAVSAVLSVAERRINLFGALVLGGITAVGGGTVRDIILGVPIFWATDLVYVWVAIGATLVTFYASKLFEHGPVRNLFLYIDGLAAGLFAIQATLKAWDLGFGLPIAPVILGVITAIGGGLIRDVLVHRENLVISRELYATPIVLGSAVFALVLALAPEYELAGSIAGIAIIVAIRSAAIRWNLHVPEWLMMSQR